MALMVIIVGCAVDEPLPGEVDDTEEAPEEDLGEADEEFFQSSYSDNVLLVEGAVEKPSPCHRLDFSYGFVERRPNFLVMEFDVLEPAEGDSCAQVISYEPFRYEAEFFGLKGTEVISDGSVKFREAFE